MIQKVNGWENVQENTEQAATLPVGAYVCRIINAKVDTMANGSQVLLIAFDIAEGDYKGYYDRQFKASTIEGKKWKGVLRQWLPTDSTDEKNERTKRGFKTLISNVERSNGAWKWNWDESQLSGKTIGILMREQEYDVNGHHGWAVRPFISLSADRVRNGDFSIPDKKPMRGDAYDTGYAYAAPAQAAQTAQAAPVSNAAPAGYQMVVNDDLPF